MCHLEAFAYTHEQTHTHTQIHLFVFHINAVDHTQTRWCIARIRYGMCAMKSLYFCSRIFHQLHKPFSPLCLSWSKIPYWNTTAYQRKSKSVKYWNNTETGGRIIHYNEFLWVYSAHVLVPDNCLVFVSNTFILSMLQFGCNVHESTVLQMRLFSKCDPNQHDAEHIPLLKKCFVLMPSLTISLYKQLLDEMQLKYMVQ